MTEEKRVLFRSHQTFDQSNLPMGDMQQVRTDAEERHRQITAAQHQQLIQQPQVAMSPYAQVQGAGGMPPNAYPPVAAPAGGNHPEAVEVTLSDGRVVELAPPNVAIPFVTAKILAGENDPSLAVYVRVLLYVRAINGVPVDRPYNKVTAERLMIELGCLALDELVQAWAECWPQVTADKLQIVKKNLR